jgi:hypothetical protein
MNKSIIIIMTVLLLAGCKNRNTQTKRIPVAEVGKVVLYYDEMPKLIQKGVNDSDSAVLFQNYINKWARRQLLLQKAEDNLTLVMKGEIAHQLVETRENLVIYQYQRQMIEEKLDTVCPQFEYCKGTLYQVTP